MQIELKDITLRYGQRTIFQNLNYLFQDGIYILQGKSGIGKTSLLNLIMQYIVCQKGTVVRPKDIVMSYVFQEDLLFHNLTVKENMFIKYNGSDKTEDLDTMINGMIHKIPIGPLLNQYVKFLSGGEKQWVQLAIATMDQPDIILLDEPFAKLDEENKWLVMEFIRREWAERLVIIVCHGMMEHYSDITYLELDQGRLYEK